MSSVGLHIVEGSGRVVKTSVAISFWSPPEYELPGVVVEEEGPGTKQLVEEDGACNVEDGLSGGGGGGGIGGREGKGRRGQGCLE